MKKIFRILCSAFLISGIFAGEDNIISLHGTWHFQTDPDDIGIAEEWYLKLLSDTIILPCSMAENVKGDFPTLADRYMD